MPRAATNPAARKVRKQKFARLLWQGKTPEEAATACGWKPGTGRSYASHPWVKNELCKLNDAVDAGAIEAAKELGRTAILSEENALVILSNMANDKDVDPRERIKAVGELSKMRGWYSARKIELTTPAVLVQEFAALGVQLPPVLAGILEEQESVVAVQTAEGPVEPVPEARQISEESSEEGDG